jgi:DNA polymerase-3 subunit epsilon
MKLTTLPHRPNAAVWAHALLQQQDWAVLDTETTGLGDAEIVEIVILDSNDRRYWTRWCNRPFPFQLG